MRFSCEFDGAALLVAIVCLFVRLILWVRDKAFAPLQPCARLIVEDLSAAQRLVRVHVRQKVQNDASRFGFAAAIFAEYADALALVLILEAAIGQIRDAVTEWGWRGVGQCSKKSMFIRMGSPPG